MRGPGRVATPAANANLHYGVLASTNRHFMRTLTITAHGQVTFRKDVLQHLGVQPGDKIEVHKFPDGKIALTAARPKGTIDKFIGLLAGRTSKIATLVEIGQAAAME
jgi:bifunctional DNA-binding transcriptional regulator/antitoxin component of YhaV-PrlF toxin-antitoxin module